MAKVDWSLIADRDDNSNYLNKNLLEFYRSLILLRKENKAFFQTNLDFIYEDHDTKVLAYQRWYQTSSCSCDTKIYFVYFLGLIPVNVLLLL